MVNSPFYDNPRWEFHLPVNPPVPDERDVDYFTGEPYVYAGPDRCDILNWTDDDGNLVFKARLKESADWMTNSRPQPRRRRGGFVPNDVATEID